MFWRFGFHNASAIDSLLDKEDVSVEAILDEDDLLQECKAQNTRLIDYFQRVDVLQRLLGYVTGQIEGEPERGQFKYPYVATEVLCSEIWSIVQTCVVNSQVELLAPFWENVLDRTPDDMKMQMVMASHFAKINAVFLSKRPTEMLEFLRTQPSIVERLLRHVETPSFVDLLVRIIQLDEQPGGVGVLEWLSSEQLVPRLLALLSPTQPPDVHTVVAELIKGIIAMATPAPGPGIAELHAAPASNLFARQLASPENVEVLIEYMMIEFPPPENETDADMETETLPNRASCASSVVHSISIIIELIRKNNSNYFEPYLFHTLRNRLIQVQQRLTTNSLDDDGGRDSLEKALNEMVDRMGVVHLGPLLQTISGRLEALQRYLRSPRSFDGPIQTTVGAITPLTFERYRICELFAELLHCSNMALLNRAPEFSSLYDSEGRLRGGLAALEDLARVIALNNGDEGDRNASMGASTEDLSRSHEQLPVSGLGGTRLAADSDEDMEEPGSSDDDSVTMEEINAVEEPPFPISAPQPQTALEPAASAMRTTPSPSPSPPLVSPPISPAVATLLKSGSTPSLRSQSSKRLSVHRRSTAPPPESPPPVGEQFKKRFVDLNVAATLLDLFFEFPWNNFLHSSVYDLVHQILTGTVDGGGTGNGNGGMGRELVVSLFRDAQLMRRIVEGQKMNDVQCAKPKSVRLGFMGHLTLIAEDVLTAIERFPIDLRDQISSYAPQPDWDEYVQGRYNETKRRDAELLGGGKPVIRSAMSGGAGGGPTKWKVDEEDGSGVTVATGAGAGGAGGAGEDGEPRGEFRRANGARPRREGSADFGQPDGPVDEDGIVPSHRFEYSDNFDDDDDDDDDGPGWLSQSTFSLRDPPVASRHIQGPTERRPLGLSSASGFDDVFGTGNAAEDPFADDDGFGPFSDAPGASGTDPFTFASSSSPSSASAFSDDMDGFDDSFGDGDFGDFQSGGSDFSASPPNDGELTPTAGSWTFTSMSASASTASGGEEGNTSPSPRRKELPEA